MSDRSLSQRADDLAAELGYYADRGPMALAGALQTFTPEILKLLRELAHAVDRMENSNGG